MLSVVPAGAAIVAVFVTLPLVAVTFAATVISKNWPEASVGRANPPALSSWAVVGVVPTVHWPGVPEQATVVFDRPARSRVLQDRAGDTARAVVGDPDRVGASSRRR